LKRANQNKNDKLLFFVFEATIRRLASALMLPNTSESIRANQNSEEENIMLIFERRLRVVIQWHIAWFL
jgi:hypothetical protein